MSIFTGYLYAILSAMGTRSEGPEYFIQISDSQEHAIAKKTTGGLRFLEDHRLHSLIGQKVRIEGEFSHDGISYDQVVPLVPGPTVYSAITEVPRPKPAEESRHKILRQGDSGPDVLSLQQALLKWGFWINKDGYFGTGTDNLVREFQATNGIPPTGAVDLKTKLALGL
jgi:hypothetical protein